MALVLEHPRGLARDDEQNGVLVVEPDHVVNLDIAGQQLRRRQSVDVETNTEELVAFYRAADVALVTPLRDGMNLVAKEYAISKVDGDGCLVLSRFAGTSRELGDAILVNPYHPQNTADGIYRALMLPAEEKQRRMQKMQGIIQRNDIYWWLEQFLRAQQEAVRERKPASS